MNHCRIRACFWTSFSFCAFPILLIFLTGSVISIHLFWFHFVCSSLSLHAFPFVYRIHDEISGGMTALDDFRQQASAVLRNRDYANGAFELRAAVTNIERHWAVAVNVATERHNSLELLLKDITEFKRLHARLLHELKQKSLLISHATQSVDQHSAGRVHTQLERVIYLFPCTLYFYRYQLVCGNYF